MIDENLGQDYDLCPELRKGIAYACKEIKVYCEDCEYNNKHYCNKFKRKENVFTGENVFGRNSGVGLKLKNELNIDGKCKHYKKKKSFISKILKI